MKFDVLTKSTNRPLSDQEQALLVCALEKAGVAEAHGAQLQTVRVVSESTSSWPVLEFSVDGQIPPVNGVMEVLADLQYHESQCLMGLMVYSKNGTVAGMECWSIDGQGEPKSWPTPCQLRPLAHNKGFNRTPESSGPAKPGEFGGGAG